MDSQVNYAESEALKEKIHETSILVEELKKEVGKIIVGQHEIIEFIIIALLCDGHILLEGVPGVAKTTMVKTVAKILELDFKRIQFTPDLLPSDLIGTLIYNQKTGDFETKKGPLFSNLILADEVNRAPAKVQSALLESMQERQITIGSTTYPLEKPFLVFATQNPIEHEGTYNLPEAQIDRFMFKLVVNHPSEEEEKEIVKNAGAEKKLSRIFNKKKLFEMQDLTKKIYRDELILDYITRIVAATRRPQNYELSELQPYILHGASPRATLALDATARSYAMLKRRHFVIPDDVKAVCKPAMRHRILLSFEAEAEKISSDKIIEKILNTIPAP